MEVDDRFAVRNRQLRQREEDARRVVVVTIDGINDQRHRFALQQVERNGERRVRHANLSPDPHGLLDHPLRIERHDHAVGSVAIAHVADGRVNAVDAGARRQDSNTHVWAVRVRRVVWMHNDLAWGQRNAAGLGAMGLGRGRGVDDRERRGGRIVRRRHALEPASVAVVPADGLDVREIGRADGTKSPRAAMAVRERAALAEVRGQRLARIVDGTRCKKPHAGGNCRQRTDKTFRHIASCFIERIQFSIRHPPSQCLNA